MSYLDFFCQNYIESGSRDDEKIKGSCYAMCPVDEKYLRVREKMVHILEVVGTEKRLVKSYCRSAADSNMAVPQHLRPFHILRSTVVYLLFEVSKRTDVPLPVVYDFVNDRLRAVRQDMTIQRLPPNQCASLLEPMVRFYVFYGYKLYGLPLKDFDPVLHRKYLIECLRWFLSCCDAEDSQESYNVEDKENDLCAITMTMGIDDTNVTLACDRVLMESLYLLSNLDDMHAMYRYINLAPDLKMHPTLRLSYSLAVANMKGNFVRVSRLLRRLCPLLHCALCQQLPQIQRRGVLVLSHAYSSKKLSVPSAALRRWLSFASDAEARAAAAHYGLTTQGSDVVFTKADLNTDVPMHQAAIQKIHDGRLNLTLENMLTYSVKIESYPGEYAHLLG